MIERTDGVLTSKVGGDDESPFTIRVVYENRDNQVNQIASLSTDDQESGREI